tara:strand:- start:254 stop:391 length:138 start_codon:yes stop_codon:yes gene_type:complete
MFKQLYKNVWVPILGRLLAKLIPIIEGKKPDKVPSYDIDGDKKSK